MARGRRHMPPVLRLATRVAGAFVVCTVLVLGSREFVERIGQNIALARELARTQHDVRSLQARRAEDVREIQRLQQPDGVVPYIYRRLRMVKPGQTLIYVVPAASATP